MRRGERGRKECVASPVLICLAKKACFFLRMDVASMNKSTFLSNSKKVLAFSAVFALIATGSTSPARALVTPGAGESAFNNPSAEEGQTLVETSQGVKFSWKGIVLADAEGNPSAKGWEVKDLGSVRLPARYVTLRMSENAPVAPKIVATSTRAWAGQYEPVVKNSVEPQYNDAGESVSVKDISTVLPIELPRSPVTVLSDGRMRGMRIVVVAISPIYEKSGEGVAVSDLEVVIPDAKLMSAADVQQALPRISAGDPATSNSVNAVDITNIDTPPINPAALVSSVRITTTRRGIQQVTGSALTASGYNLSGKNINNSHVYYRGTEVATQIIDGGTPGVFDASDQILFYANPGDRWNKFEVYWLTFDSTPGLRMGTRNVAAVGGDPTRSTAYEQDTWQLKRLYDSTAPGVDNDYIFSYNFNAQFSTAVNNIYLTPTLPLAAGNMVFQLNTYIYSYVMMPTGYQWNLTGNTTGESVNSSVVSTFGSVPLTVTLTQMDPSIKVTLPQATNRAAYLESIAYKRPVSLNFSGVNGAEFVGEASAYNYTVSNASVGSSLYDISNSLYPVALMNVASSGFTFHDSAPGGYRYLLTGSQTLFQPAVAPHTPLTINQPLNSQALYIGPSYFNSPIQPLIALRQSQGYSASFVDVQKIYDAWSYGRVSGDALRDFLRYAATTWGVAPISAVLVGHTSADPLGYASVGMGYAAVASNTVPSLFTSANLGLDKMGELPCDMCIGQLDGASPLPTTPSLTSVTNLPEVSIGRFPVKSVQDLTALVSKITGYETQFIGQAAWARRASFISDNYPCPSSNVDGCVSGAGTYAGYKVDPAGDFYAETQAEIDRLPGWMTRGCDEYRPAPPDSPATTNPCFEATPTNVRQRAVDLYTQGALTMVYIGHGVERYIAAMDSPTNWILHSDFTIGATSYTNDVSSMNNGFKLPVLLSMTCLTSRFVTFAYKSGTFATIDEQIFLRPNGGSIAVFGPTGADSVAAHQGLLVGFMNTLWSAKYQPTLAELTQAARYNAVTNSPTNFRSVIFSFVLLGDPLTKIRKNVSNVYVPSTLRTTAANW